MKTERRPHVLPFPALVGQSQLKQALEMLAVNPRLGGILIRGEKGTAKSTAARALADLMPPVRVNAGCKFGCPADRPDAWCSACAEREPDAHELRRPPFENLPLGITEDQLIGTLDLERALRDGECEFSPGLLARVNQGILYVDEVNLLEDHLVDLLLDTAAHGVNVVAREGVSVSHPSEFMLVGTMNPEEGDLRPQLLDRFGLCVDVQSLSDPDARAEVVVRRLAFESDPAAFRAQWHGEEEKLAHTIGRARELLGRIRPSRRWCESAARIALDLEVHGHRADLLMVKGAATLAALDGRVAINAEDLEGAARAVLPHRLRRRPFEEESLGSLELRERVRGAMSSEKKNSR